MDFPARGTVEEVRSTCDVERRPRPRSRIHLPMDDPEPDVRHRISLTALLLGVGLLWPLPLAAAVLMVAATFGLVISWEEKLNVAPVATVTDPFAPNSTPHPWKDTQ